MTSVKAGISPKRGTINASGAALGSRVEEKDEGAAEEDDEEKEDDYEDDEAVQLEPGEFRSEAFEAAPVRVARDPGDPTPEEREEHCATHLPYRSWCPVCVKAKGKEESHRDQSGEEKSTKPTICLDYKAFGQEMHTDDKATAIVGRDAESRMSFAHICETKGASDKWIIDKLLADIERLGYTDIIIKGDSEPALVQVMNEIKKRRAHSTIVQTPPAYDPQANGRAEKVVQEYMGQLRALKIGMEARLGCKIESDWPVMEWLSEHASELMNRCQVGRDGRTPYYRLYGKFS